MMSSFHLPEDIPSIAVSATYSACERRSAPAGARTRHFGRVKKRPQHANQALKGQIRGNVGCDMAEAVRVKNWASHGIPRFHGHFDHFMLSMRRAGPFFGAFSCQGHHQKL